MTENIPIDSATFAPKKVDFCESWYNPDIKDLPVETRDLFEQYSSIPAEDVVDHIQKMRSRAFSIYPYPCIGQLRFLNLSLSRHPLYPEVLARLRPQIDLEAPRFESLNISGKSSGISYVHSSPQVLLDLGCCLAQDLRKLVFDGVPSEKLYGLDVEKGFIDLSYDLFNDHATFKSQFVIADMLLADVSRDSALDADSSTDGLSAVSTPAPTSLALLENRISVVVANSIFHLYNYADQLRLAKRIVRLLSPERGSLILGRQVGSSQPGEYNALNNQGTRYAHDATSFRRFWGQVAEDIGGGCKFRVETVLDEEEVGDNKSQGHNWSEPNVRRMRFGVWRE
ncbi:MAG: hypothetical protein LQ349_008915 [Xanthoria aureola]|nr:MAG: hypothetical protein LQ349_008915 [Xanthoria aureola]